MLHLPLVWTASVWFPAPRDTGTEAHPVTAGKNREVANMCMMLSSMFGA